MLKKINLLLLLFLIFGAVLIFAAGGQQAKPAAGAAGPVKEPITLRFWGGVQPEYGYDLMAEQFSKEFANKGLRMEYVRYVNDNNGNLQLDTYLASGGEIDIFMGYGATSRLIPRVKSALVLDMTDRLKARNFDFVKELGANNVNGFLLDNRAYGLPTKYENTAWIFANVQRFKDAGIPLPYNGWTFDEFRDAMKKLTRGSGVNKEYGMYWGVTYDRSISKTIMGSVLGSRAIYKDEAKTETNFDHPVWAQGLQLMVDTMRNDKTAFSLEEEVADRVGFADAYLTGKAALSVGIAQIRIVKDINEYPHKFTTALVPAPVPSRDYWQFADQNHRPGAGDLICVSSKTKYPDECVDAVIWYIKGGMAPLARGGRIPLWTGVNKQDVVREFLDGAEGTFDIQSMQKYLAIDNRNAFVDSPGPANPQINTVFAEEMDAALYGKKTVQQALADAKSRSDLLIKNALGR
ncbi:MAG: extracellular solute-binding protein [Treponema sp.]|nr:extracellular solute-binding protein [Treponema sp.]